MSKGKLQHIRFSKLKRFVARIICHDWVGRVIGAIFGDRIPSQGFRIYTCGNIAPKVKAYIFWGIYESAEIRFIHGYLRTDLDVIELGSSLGVVSCHIARKLKLDSGHKLICVEANPFLFDNIQRNLKEHCLNSGTLVISAAISYTENHDGKSIFNIGVSNLDSSNRGPGTKTLVKRTTLSSILEENKITRYSLVMDIEGAEIEILKYDRDALTNCQQIIAELHETHDGQLSIEDMIQILIEEFGFQLLVRRGPVCVFQK